ncbi:GIY-YIG nuclease family protein [Ferrimonas balearica]|uniref:GIY-YIG nuclease family protein n=1 Tax=Ferrimonas balearica TaxID=44012 RepID=UPI001C58C29A|nr:GIY-YIG nuclease family protein [Ferrimonas balearica]MBW3163148.1 GIY-YIG nuclease family protein [Ferrimonas balearica]MBY6016839.1 GIY-YIG nuclease family protein [Halomonas denitrificans]MBY6094871.1 GIY-YIG nuclease family protein [Ferrimonas balearica]
MSDWFLYLVRTRSGHLYTGITTDVERRFAEHQAGAPKGARALRGKGPLTLVYQSPAGSRSDALKAEYRIKQLSKSAKEALVSSQVPLNPDPEGTPHHP